MMSLFSALCCPAPTSHSTQGSHKTVASLAGAACARMSTSGVMSWLNIFSRSARCHWRTRYRVRRHRQLSVNCADLYGNQRQLFAYIWTKENLTVTSELRIFLLGRPRFVLRGEVEGFVSQKAMALLCFLVSTRRTYSRDYLAALLWGDMPEETGARQSSHCLAQPPTTVCRLSGVQPYRRRFQQQWIILAGHRRLL